MVDVLNLKPGTEISGKEIKDWIMYQITNKTSFASEAKRIRKYVAIDEEKEYYIKNEYNPKDISGVRSFLAENPNKSGQIVAQRPDGFGETIQAQQMINLRGSQAEIEKRLDRIEEILSTVSIPIHIREELYGNLNVIHTAADIIGVTLNELDKNKG